MHFSIYLLFWYIFSLSCLFISLLMFLLDVLYIYIYFFFIHITFFTFLFFYMYICIFPYLYIFIFSYFHSCLFSYFHTFLFFYIFNIFFILIFLQFVPVIVYYCIYDWMSVCDCMFRYAWHVSVLVYCPTYCGGCLVRGRGCLLNGQTYLQSRRSLKYTLIPPHPCFNKQVTKLIFSAS